MCSTARSTSPSPRGRASSRLRWWNRDPLAGAASRGTLAERCRQRDDGRTHRPVPRDRGGRSAMKRLIGVAAAVLLALAGLPASGDAAAPRRSSAREPVDVIFDTDMALDVDDVGALALLHALANRGECRILAGGVSESARASDGLW